MGNNNSAIDFEYKISANDYKPIEKIKDPRLGELIQMKHNVTEQTIMMKEKTIKDSDTYKRTLEEYVNHMALKHRNLGRVYGFAGADSQEKNKAKIYIYFEYFPETLHGEINAKKLGVAQKAPATKGSSKFFDEPSLFKIAAEIVDVLEYLQQNSISHGEIKPDSCFVSKSGSVKIMDRKLVCDTTSAYELVKEGDRTFFLTPKAFSCIKKGLNEPIEDKYRADVFSLGLTLLECATLKPSSQIYDWNNYSLNLTLLSNRLIEVKDRYSASFYNLLKGMVRIEEEQRPDFITLKNVLEEEGWINAYATSSPNFTDDEIVPELITQVENKKNAPAIQTKGLRDSQHPVLVSPTKSPMPQKGGNSMFSHSIFGKDKPQTVQKHLVDTRGPLSTDEHMEDILPSERVYNVNKVPEATINRSAGTPKGLMSRTGSTSLQEMVLSRNTLDRPRDIRDTVSSNNVGGYYINDKFKNKFSKLHGTFSKTSTSTSFPNKTSFQQAQQSFETPKQSQSQAFIANNKTKAIFSDKPEFTKNAPSSTLPDHSVFSEEPSSIIGYQYNYDSAQVKREFCVENLLQEALQRSAKHPNLTLLHQAPQNRSQSDKLNSIPPRILGSVARRPSEKTLGGVSPFGKSKLTINCDYNNSEQSMRDNITPFTIPSNKISFKEDDCNSEVTYFAPGAQTKPENFISSQNSFLEFDSVRSSHRPIVVDVVENANEFNKFLIDSIVKPETFKAKALGNIGHSPFGKQKNQNLQAQRDQVVCREFQNETNQVPDINKNFQPKELAKLIGKEAPKTEKIGLDTSLEEDLDKAQKEVYTYSKGLSTGEEIGSQGYGSNQFNANKFAEEDPLEELIQKAIERSRQTYLMTTGGLAEAYRNENVASNASESKFSDILASNNGINNEQFKADYESKFAPCSQIES